MDFHGDLVELVLGCIPEGLQDHVALIDLANRAYPVGINPLDMAGGQDRDKVVDNLISIVEAIWSRSYGSRTENILEYACKTLAEANLTLLARDPLQGPAQQYTLLDVVSLLRRASFRHAVFEQVQDRLLTDWWRHYYELLDARQQAEYSSSTVTKLSKFASSRISRSILGQPHSTVEMAELIRQEKIVLINCASGNIGGNLAALLGSLLMGLFHIALAEQARLHPGERHPFLVLIDEFQALAGINYQTMLAELRKYGGTFGLATQSLAYLDRLDRTLRATVLANIDHLFAFAMAAEDAHLLRLDGVEPEDLTSLPNYTCYARLLLDGRRLPLFSLRLDAPPDHDEEQARLIAQASQRRYGRPLGDVEAALLAMQARQETMQPQPKPRKPGLQRTTQEQGGATSDPQGAPRRRGGSSGKASAEAPSPASPPVPTALDGSVLPHEQASQGNAPEESARQHEKANHSVQEEGTSHA